jgi:membrane dipeptidase
MSTPEDASTASPGLTDIHVHPAMNAYFFNRDLRRHYCSGDTFNPFASLSDFKMLEKGGVRVLWSSLHVPEKDFLKCKLLDVAVRFTRGGRKYVRLGAWECLLDMMGEMERQVARAGDRFALARSNAELDAAVASGKRAVVHTVEGGHALGSGLGPDDVEGRLARLDELAARGVASLTLAHIFPTELAGHINSIEAGLKKLPLCRLDTGVDESRGLSRLGEAVVERMVALRMLPDVTHCTEVARRRVLEVVDRRIPVVATHTGSRELNDVSYNLRPGEVRAIADTGGVVGVIFMPKWLDRVNPKQGLDAIWRTMVKFAEAAGGWEAVAIGTDFDGFTDPPDDCPDASHLPRIGEMLARNGLSAEKIAAVLGGNARRVLRLGWR